MFCKGLTVVIVFIFVFMHQYSPKSQQVPCLSCFEPRVRNIDVWIRMKKHDDKEDWRRIVECKAD